VLTGPGARPSTYSAFGPGGPGRTEHSVTDTTSVHPRISDEELPRLMSLLEGADTVELKLTVPDGSQRSAVVALGMDPLDANLRQVFFFDTPDLALNRHGVIVRARRAQGGVEDFVVKLRPVVPNELPAKLRKLPGFGVEVDAMPGGFVCSGRLKESLRTGKVKEAVLGTRLVRTLFSKQQRAFLADHAPEGVAIDDLVVLGPITVLKLKFVPGEYGRRLVAELWSYPDGSRILELSTKCAPAEAFDVAAKTRAFLAGRGIDLTGEQQTKTKSALEFFSREVAGT
jgi:hypothetical protein